MTEIFGHRGASGCAPENTLEAFELAVRQKADGVELDVQLTADGKLVVIHDEKIDRVSSGKGYVKDFTLDELRQYSFDNGMEGFHNIKIPTLKEVLDLLEPSGIKVNIELKTGIFWYPDIEAETIRTVRECGMEKRVIYSSFNHYSIQTIKKLSPEAETAYLFSDVMLDVEKYAVQSGVYGLHPAVWHMKMGDFAQRYRESGCRVRVWTVNEEEDMKNFILAGVDGVITNYPGKAVEIRDGLSDQKRF